MAGVFGWEGGEGVPPPVRDGTGRDPSTGPGPTGLWGNLITSRRNVWRFISKLQLLSRGTTDGTTWTVNQKEILFVKWRNKSKISPMGGYFKGGGPLHSPKSG